MKKNSAVLSVVVLALAAAGLVFSLLFFSKKGDFIVGWKKLASAINRGSSEMDKNNGTDYAKDLTVRSLQHEKYAQLDQRLIKLQAQSRAFVKSRDTLAEASAAVAKKAGISKFTKTTSLTQVKDPAAVNELGREINTIFENRDRSYAKLALLTKGLGFTLDPGKLVRGDSDALQPFNQGLFELYDRKKVYEGALKGIAVCVGLNSYDLSDDNYKEASLQLLSTLAKCQVAHEKLTQKMDQVRMENQKLAAQDKEQKDQLASQQKALADRDRQIAGFKEALKEAAPVLEAKTPWKNGSREARAALEARVVQVDEDYGIVTINAGRETTVFQKIAEGEKRNEVNVGISEGDEIVIVRGDLSRSPEYLTSLKLEKVTGKEAVGRIPAGCTSIRVGDRVVLRPTSGTAAN